jgi:hypothetical protein
MKNGKEIGVSTYRWFWLGLLVISALVACRGGDGELEDVVVELAVMPDPPHLGPATVVVSLSDDQGPIAGATLSLEGNMNHAGMVPVLADATEVSPGRYEAALEFTMGGDWFILVEAELADGRTLEHKVDLPGITSPHDSH